MCNTEHLLLNITELDLYNQWTYKAMQMLHHHSIYVKPSIWFKI